MKSIRKFLIMIAERFLDRYKEGAIAPSRFFEMVEEFDKSNEHATRREWAHFSTALMAEAYRDGYIRGREYTDRDRDEWFPNPRPEVLANTLMPGWDKPLNHAMYVPDTQLSRETETEKIQRQLREMGKR